MSIRFLAVAFGGLALLVFHSEPAWAQATPHDTGGNSSYSCLSCHAMHVSVGPNLTRQATNAALCQSCHKDTGDASSLAMPDSSMATPGAGGASHKWQALANQSAYGATLPLGSAFALHIDETDIQNPKIFCSTCHNQHSNSAKYGPLRKDPITKTTISAGTGTVTYAATGSPTAKGYLIEVVNAGSVAAGTLTYRLSNDSGRSWYGWNAAGSVWELYSGTNARLVTAATATQTLNDGTNVSVTFVDGAGPSYFVAADRWQFYVAYPFLRAAADSGDNTTGSLFCRACHSSRAQTYTDVRTYTGTYRSHPVGQVLNANGGGYDRATPLDVSGAAQGATALPSYMVLDAGGRVQCSTCHAMHYAPSNSLYDPQGKR